MDLKARRLVAHPHEYFRALAVTPEVFGLQGCPAAARVSARRSRPSGGTRSTATTVDGRPAKCFMGKDGQARWGYNSG